MALLLFGPPLTWLAILWSDPAASGLPHPAFAYGLAAIAVVPGAIGLSLLPLRTRTKWLILPFYLIAMAVLLSATLVGFVCVAMHDCP
ncbi:hypothetical protein RN629_07050 [Sphingomonadaceae bacterium jetA1]|jgi:hypothetical protein|uniref:hypothetical protein n=1 Tax=Facivitalis istanbulensis TaxID=3075838 RepID=UPI00347457B7